jgi:SAM-dependent methyltransferase
LITEDQKKWDAKHAGSQDWGQPSGFLQQVFTHYASLLLPGTALDIASGRGRNALFLAARGWKVEALDVSPVALEQLAERARNKGYAVSVKQVDLNHVELPGPLYDLIVNFNFLQRSLTGQIKRALKPGGYVIFETFLIDQRDFGHPKNPDYLLGHNELLGLFGDFRVLYYREGKFADADQNAFRAGIFAQKVR